MLDFTENEKVRGFTQIEVVVNPTRICSDPLHSEVSSLALGENEVRVFCLSGRKLARIRTAFPNLKGRRDVIRSAAEQEFVIRKNFVVD